MSPLLIRQMLAILLKAIEENDASLVRNQLGALSIYAQAWTDDYHAVITDLEDETVSIERTDPNAPQP